MFIVAARWAVAFVPWRSSSIHFHQCIFNNEKRQLVAGLVAVTDKAIVCENRTTTMVNERRANPFLIDAVRVKWKKGVSKQYFMLLLKQ